jgi:hypothetical protein
MLDDMVESTLATGGVHVFHDRGKAPAWFETVEGYGSRFISDEGDVAASRWWGRSFTDEERRLDRLAI